MMGGRVKFGVGIVLAGLMAGCATKPVAPPPPPSPRPVPPAVVPALGAAAYVEQSGSASLALIRAGEMAAVRSSDGRVKALAAMLVADHKGIGAQLSFAGRRLDLLPPAVPVARHAAALARLEAAGDFDAAYREVAGSLVNEAMGMHEAYATGGDSPTLRQVARMAGPIVRGERERLRGR